jgi:hypothetical protein
LKECYGFNDTGSGWLILQVSKASTPDEYHESVDWNELAKRRGNGALLAARYLARDLDLIVACSSFPKSINQEQNGCYLP